jgi:hypothetical protein
MRHLLPPLHEGHAPIFLHQAFEDALDAFGNWAPGTTEPHVHYEGLPTAVSAVFGRMRSCTDILPMRILQDVQAVLKGTDDQEFGGEQASYAEAALILRAHCVARLKS